MYEVKGSNHLKAIFNSKKNEGEDNVFTKVVCSAPKTSPKVLIINSEEKMMALLDLLKRAPKEKKDDESGQSSNEEKSEKDKDDAASDSEEETDFGDIDHLVVYTAVLPENLSIGTGDSVMTDFKAFFTPSLVNGVLLSSCLGAD